MEGNPLGPLCSYTPSAEYFFGPSQHRLEAQGERTFWLSIGHTCRPTF